MAALRLVSGFLLLAAAAGAQDLQGLLDNSPFGKARTNAAGAAETGGQLEFRGVAEENGVLWFSLYDTATKRSTWVRRDAAGTGPAIRAYDPATPAVTIEYQSKTLTLPLRRAPQIAVAPQPQQGGSGPVPGNPVVIGGAVSGGPAPMDAARIQQIQEEIRRRRALRQQAIQPNAPPTPTGQPVPGGNP